MLEALEYVPACNVCSGRLLPDASRGVYSGCCYLPSPNSFYRTRAPTNITRFCSVPLYVADNF